jgi:hypothetical protein
MIFKHGNLSHRWFSKGRTKNTCIIKEGTNKLNYTYLQNILIFLFTRCDCLVDDGQILNLLTLLRFSTRHQSQGTKAKTFYRKTMQPQRIYTTFCCSNGNKVRQNRRWISRSYIQEIDGERVFPCRKTSQNSGAALAEEKNCVDLKSSPVLIVGFEILHQIAHQSWYENRMTTTNI